ncbi:3249_t:CDS:2 [Racocetra persica]|uniref:3249_t:CDS:1 n=1 Tax=Racocetra persica TaxID=160502 RepID=A0ACA9MVJ6_9GLOM|nr:3249_t:CDS:2 [Racocetra persica]
MERLINSKSSIARYRIIFLPERNLYDPIRRLYVNKEWLMMESTWEKIEKKIVSSLPPIAENLESLLEKYNKAIIDATTGYYVDLQKRLVSSVDTTNLHHLLKMFPDVIQPLNDADVSEYAYRSWIVNQLWEEIFLDVNSIIRMKTGEVENIDRKTQLDLARDVDKRKSCVGSWHHDAILTMKAGNKDFQIAFGEVIGNAFKQDDKKLNEDREKILKAMRLALPKLLKLLPENVPGIEELETFGLLVYKKKFLLYSMHYVDGIYFVNQYDGFTIPDTPLQLGNISDIIRIMLMFKNRVIKLQQHVESLYKSKTSFKHGSTLHANDDDSDILVSIH